MTTSQKTARAWILALAPLAFCASAQDSRPESGPSGEAETRPVAESGPTDSRDAAASSRRSGRRGPRPGRGAESRAAAKSESRPESVPTSPFLAVVDGVVYTGVGATHRRGSVLLKEGKIVDVGPRVSIPDGARVIDAKGKHVAPGFVSVSAFGTFSGGFTARGEEKAGDEFDPYSQRMLMALASGVTTACEGVIQGGGGFFGGRVRGARGSGTPVGQLAGFAGKHVYGTVEGVTLREGVAWMVQYSASDVVARGQTREAIEKAVAAKKRRAAPKDKDEAATRAETIDETTRNWLRVFDGELPCFIVADDAPDLVAVADLSAEYDLPVVVVGGEEAWIQPSRLARGRLSFILNPRRRDGSGGFTDPYKGEPNGWSVRTAAIVGEAGFRWCVQPLSGAVGTGGLMGRDLLQLNMDAAFTVRGGASEADALASITSAAARILKLDDRVGSLERGKDGDVLVMDLDPLDYRSFAEIVIVDGRVVYEKDKVSFFNHVQTDRSAGLKGRWSAER